MKTKTKKQTIYLFMLIISISFVCAGNMTIEELVNSYDYDFIIDGADGPTINITSFNDSMRDTNSNGIADVLIFNLTTKGVTSSEFKFILELKDGEDILISSGTKKINQSRKNALLNFSSELLKQNKFNYSVRIYDINKTLVFRKYNLETNNYPSYESGTKILSVSDENINNDYLRIGLTINSTKPQTKNITVVLKYNDSKISTTEEKILSNAVQTIYLKIDNETIKNTHYNGKYNIDSAKIGKKKFELNQNTSPYNYETFAKTSYIKSFSDGAIDTNNNSLFEFIEINITSEIKTDGEYGFYYDLYDEYNNYVSSINKTLYLTTGNRKIQTLINASDIYKTQIDGPYKLSYILLKKNSELKDIITSPYITKKRECYEFERPPQPDLDIKMNVAFNLLEGISQASVNITNKGKVPAFNVFLDIFDNNTYSNSTSIPFINVDESIITQFKITDSSNSSIITAIADIENIVDESNESNNLAQHFSSSSVNQTIQQGINLYDFNAETFEKSVLFDFKINNTGESKLVGLNWSLDTKEEKINSTSQFDLETSEYIFVFASYNYSNLGEYDTVASSFNSETSDSQTLKITLKELLINTFNLINQSEKKATFEFIIKNNLKSNLTNISWKLDTKDNNIINNSENIILSSYEEIFTFVDYNFSQLGTYNTNITTTNKTLKDSKSLIVTVVS